MHTRLVVGILSMLLLSPSARAYAQKASAPSRGAYAKPTAPVSPQEKAKVLQAGKDARAQALITRGRSSFRPGTVNLSKPSPLALGLRGRSFGAVSRTATLSERASAPGQGTAPQLLAAVNSRAQARATNKGAPVAQPQHSQTPTPPAANSGQGPAADAATPGDGVAVDAPAAAAKKSDVGAAKPRAEPAPPLDEWDEYVAKVSERYQFTDSQNARAQAILASLRHRAQQYRLGRLPEIEAAEKIQSPEAREGRLQSLNRPIDELFGELRMRLENLPTIAQKLRAEQAPVKR